MRLKSELWVKAYIRRCNSEGAPAAVLRRGAADAGAILIKVNLLDGRVRLFGPAPAGMETASFERSWIEMAAAPLSEQSADDAIARQLRFDPDIWVVEMEDRDGRHFLEDTLVKS